MIDRENVQEFVPPLVFMHIPKTAGQALIASFLEWYAPADCLALYTPPLPMSGFEYRIGSALPPRFVCGHFSCGLPERLIGIMACRYITFLRHPRDRIVSQYVFDRDYYFGSTMECERVMKERIFTLDAVAFVNGADSPVYDNLMTRQASGVGFAVPVGSIDAAIFEMAKINLGRFFFVGFQECYVDSISRLGDRLGMTLKDERLNCARVELLTEILSGNEIEELGRATEKNIFDLQLYYWAIEYFQLRQWKHADRV